MFTVNGKLDLYESMRLATEYNGSKIKGHFPFAEQREVQSMQSGGQNWASGVGLIG